MTEIQKNARESCCAPERAQHRTGCLLCGKPLVYFERTRPLRCAVCGKEAPANAACEDGHFVCDRCHESSSAAFFLPLLLASTEQDPLALFERIVALPQVHMHGPEHHLLVPCVLLSAYRSSGGELELEPALREALRRASQVPGGSCGYWGVCGAAVGAGIYMSILLGSNPLHREAWPIPQRLVAACLNDIAERGGPRCCKRTGRLAITRAAAFTEELLGVAMPLGRAACRHFPENRECLYRDCPYFPGSQA